MGVDFLDMTIRTERVFRIKITKEQGRIFAERIGGKDFTPGQWFDFVWELRMQEYPGQAPDRDWPCFRCGYNQRGLGERDRCPECGRRNDHEAAWAAMLRILQDVLGKRAGPIRRDSLMIKELGFS